jgi:hypothetical protein
MTDIAESPGGPNLSSAEQVRRLRQGSAQLPPRAVCRRLVSAGQGHQGRRGDAPGPDRRGSCYDDGAAPLGGQALGHPRREGPGLFGLAHPAPSEAGNFPALRLSLSREKSTPSCQAEDQDVCVDRSARTSRWTTCCIGSTRCCGAGAATSNRLCRRWSSPTSATTRGERYGDGCRKHRKAVIAELRRLYWRRRVVAGEPTQGTVSSGEGEHDPLPLPRVGHTFTPANHRRGHPARRLTGACGEPGALKDACRVREAVRGNRPAAQLAPRPGPTFTDRPSRAENRHFTTLCRV